jgi:hypothetical protein
MSFLAPLFLAGLAAVAVPILIHLVKREHGQLVPFPSIMFLRRLRHESTRQRKIRHWLLLLLRTAALALIVAAFARPLVRRETLAVGPTTGAREVVILVDRSYSMAYGDRWARAQEAARQAVRTLGATDKATLVLFGRGADADLRSTTDRARLLSAIDGAEAGYDVTRFGPALKLAQGILEGSTQPRREVILISDFQRTGWDGAKDTARFPTGTVITPVPIGDPDPSNVTVVSAAFARQAFSGQDRVIVSAALMNRASRGVDGLEVRLELDGRQIEVQKVALGPRASGSVTFAPFTLAEPIVRGAVRIAPDALPRDDAFNFVLSPIRPVSVLIVEPAEAGRALSLYLTNALGIGDKPVFKTERVRIDRLTSSDFATRSVVVMNDVAPPRGAVADALRQFVETGGGVLAVLGERASWSGRDGLLPGSAGGTVERSARVEATLGTIDYAHPVFEVFRAPRAGDLSSARFYRYRRFAVGESARVIARFDDGEVALAEGAVGSGRVLVWTSTLDSFWNDLALKPVYLPFVHRMVRHLAAYAEREPWLTVGQVVDVTKLTGFGSPQEAMDAEGSSVVVQVPGGRRTTLGAEGTSLLTLDREGFYEVHAPSAPRSQVKVVAVNVDRSESDLTSMEPATLVSALGSGDGANPSSAESQNVTPEEEERRQAFWWYLLAAGIGLLVAETILSNRLARGRSQDGPPALS